MQIIQKIIDYLYKHSTDYIFRWRKHLKEFAIAVILALIFRNVVAIYRIPTSSMTPTLKVGDTLIGNSFYYGLKIPFTESSKKDYRLPALSKVKRGDIVIFRESQEDRDYVVQIVFNDDAVKELWQLNEIAAQQGKRPYGILEGKTNYIFIPSNFELQSPITSEEFQQSIKKGTLSIVIPRKTFLWHIKNRSELKKLNINDYHLLVEQPQQRTFANSDKVPLMKLIFNGPVFVFSILTSSIVNTPYFYFYKNIIDKFFVNEKKIKIKETILGQEILSFYPNSWMDNTKLFVKRVIAKGGDTIAMQDGKVYLNGNALGYSKERQDENGDNSYTLMEEKIPLEDGKFLNHIVRFKKSEIYSPDIPFNQNLWPYDAVINDVFRDNFGPITVPEGYFFVMGDNRHDSSDSRYWGLLPRSAITGSPSFMFFPTIKKIN